MRAHPGDWLVVERSDLHHQARRGRIEEVGSADGTPPYRVRWLDADRSVLVFPGPDAHVLTQAELDQIDAQTATRFAAVQRDIATRRPT
jgi:hypothetical protein